MHINEGKDKLALFSTKYNVLLTPHPSYSSAIDLFSRFDFTLFFNFHPRPNFFMYTIIITFSVEFLSVNNK